MVVIINGMPRSGKDTFVNYCHDLAKDYHIYMYSTVDFVKFIATKCGWDGTKDAKNRKFLSDLKDLLTEWGDVPFSKSMEEIGNAFVDALQHQVQLDKMIIFIHCREPKEITKFQTKLGSLCSSLLIRRAAVEGNDQSNHADQNVLNYDYTDIIENNGTLEELKDKAREYLIAKIGEENLKW